MPRPRRNQPAFKFTKTGARGGPLGGAPKLSSIPYIAALAPTSMTQKWPACYLSRIMEAPGHTGVTLMGFQYYAVPFAAWPGSVAERSVMMGSGLFRATARETNDFGLVQNVSAADSLNLNIFRRCFERQETVAQAATTSATQAFSSMLNRSVKGLIGLSNEQALYFLSWFMPLGSNPTTCRLDAYVRFSLVSKEYNAGNVGQMLQDADDQEEPASEQDSLLGLSDPR